VKSPVQEQESEERMKLKKAVDLLRDLQGQRDQCEVHDMTLVESVIHVSLTKEQTLALKDRQHRAFLLWWDSWIAPKLTEVYNCIAPRKAVSRG
jgi:hypothetical protein